jgi:hypothetical protein
VQEKENRLNKKNNSNNNNNNNIQKKRKRFKNINTLQCGVLNNNDTSNNRDNWNHLKIIHNIHTSSTPEKHDIKDYRKQPYWTQNTYFGKY